MGNVSGYVSTPHLLLDKMRMHRNIARLKTHLTNLKVPLRPHLKTCKSMEVARLLMSSSVGPAAVSTLKEAEYFGAQGVKDILYAVGIARAKLPRVLALRRAGVDLSVILDSVEQTDAVIAACREANDRIPVLIEIDSDGDRAGIRPGDPTLLEIGRRLHDGGAELRGVMTHAGASYECPNSDSLIAAAEAERLAALSCAQDLRQSGLSCAVVSVGSTPTAHFARDLSGVTEVRAGVFVFMDLVMVGLGVCTMNDIALSVIATVIGHQRAKGWILVDAGWTAVSHDRGTSHQATDQCYGVVCDLDGRAYPDLLLTGVNQEHGVISLRPGSEANLPDLAVGSLLRILPNHACATAAQYDRYHVLGEQGAITEVWSRFRGW